MKRKRRSTGIIAFTVFVMLILLGGYALNAAGYDDNPFPQIAFLTSSTTSGGGRFPHDASANTGSSALALLSSDTADTGIDLTGLNTPDTQFQLPPVSDLSSSDTAAPPNLAPDAFGGSGQDDQDSISWADIGDVLYNLWFICVVTAIFIVVQQVLKLSVKQFKSRMPRLAAAK